MKCALFMCFVGCSIVASVAVDRPSATPSAPVIPEFHVSTPQGNSIEMANTIGHEKCKTTTTAKPKTTTTAEPKNTTTAEPKTTTTAEPKTTTTRKPKTTTTRKPKTTTTAEPKTTTTAEPKTTTTRKPKTTTTRKPKTTTTRKPKTTTTRKPKTTTTAEPKTTTTAEPKTTTTAKPKTTTTAKPKTTTTAEPKTTTTAEPKTTTTAEPKTTTTAEPKTTTTAEPKTTTTAEPKTTTTAEPKTTTTAKPTMPPTPTPPTTLVLGNYNVTKKDTTCLLAQMALQIRLVSAKVNGTFIVQPNKTKIFGFCRQADAFLNITFGEGFISFKYFKNSTNNTFFVNDVSFSLAYPFSGPATYSPGSRAVHIFDAAVGHAATCKNESVDMGSGLYLDITQARMQAFNFTENNKFDISDACPADRPSYGVAIGIGVFLLVLIIIVVAAFVIFRSRRTGGYQTL